MIDHLFLCNWPFRYSRAICRSYSLPLFSMPSSLTHSLALYYQSLYIPSLNRPVVTRSTDATASVSPVQSLIPGLAVTHSYAVTQVSLVTLLSTMPGAKPDNVTITYIFGFPNL